MLYVPAMQKSLAIQHFGSVKKLAETLGISRAAVAQWGEIVPPLRAMQLHELTGGQLVYRAETYADWFDKFRGDRQKSTAA